MPAGLAIAGATVIGGGISAYGATKAAEIQAKSAQNALAMQRQMYDQGRSDIMPFMETGKNALMSLAQLYGLPGADGAAGGEAFSDNALEAFRRSPDYSWRVKEGMNALTLSNAARGRLLSRGHLNETVAFGQGAAGLGFNDYAQRLLALGQIGAGAANTSMGAATGQGNALANTTMAAGQAEASGVVGGTNAINSALGSGVNNLLLWNAINGRNSAYGMRGAPNGFNPWGGDMTPYG